MRASRRTSIISAVGLLASGLTALAVQAPAADGKEPFTERWCTTGSARPCVVAATKNGAAVNAGNSEIQMVSPQDLGGYRNFTVQLNDLIPASVSDQWSVLIDTGTGFNPERLIGFNTLDDVDMSTNPEGHHLVRLTAHPILWSDGCDSNAAWPWPCPSNTGDHPKWESDIADLDDNTDSSIGAHAGTNVTFNGIFLQYTSEGTPYLYTEMVSPHLRADGTTVVVGDTRFRVPYSTLRDEWGIPNPETLVPGSFAGSINGNPDGGNFAISQDPDGFGILIDVTGFTFSLKKLKVARGTIWPTRNSILRTSRVTAYKGKVVFTRSKPRGAKVTGYVARCVAGKHVVTVRGGYPSIVVTGLHRGVAYYCKVKATSKVGPSAWSVAKKIPARP